MDSEDIKFIRVAIEKAQESVAQGGYPFGAVVVKDGKEVGAGISIGGALHDPTSHGETAAIRQACRNLQTADLGDAILYASAQPCVMCLGAAMWGGIAKIIYACRKEKVSADYYGGDYHVADINAQFLRPLTLTHCAELENDSLAVLHAWETAQTNKSNP